MPRPGEPIRGVDPATLAEIGLPNDARGLVEMMGRYLVGPEVIVGSPEDVEALDVLARLYDVTSARDFVAASGPDGDKAYEGFLKATAIFANAVVAGLRERDPAAAAVFDEPRTVGGVAPTWAIEGAADGQ